MEEIDFAIKVDRLEGVKKMKVQILYDSMYGPEAYSTLRPL